MSKFLLSLLIALSLTPVSGFAALIDNIQAYYPMSSTADSTGNGNTLTNTGSVAFSTPAIITNAAQFTNSDTKRLSVSGSNGFNATGGNTWNFWVYINSNTSGYYLDLETTTGANRRIIVYNPTSTSRIDVLFGLNNVSSASLSTATWYMLTVRTCGTGANQATYFINGALVGTSTLTTGLTGSNNFFSIGNQATLLSAEVDAAIDEFGKWNRCLSDAEVTSLYNGGTPGADQQYPFGAAASSPTTLGFFRFFKRF